jgi:hypothetical protein
MSSLVEHFRQCSVCDPPVEILDEVHQSNPVNPLEDRLLGPYTYARPPESPGRV